MFTKQKKNNEVLTIDAKHGTPDIPFRNRSPFQGAYNLDISPKQSAL